MTDKFDGKRIFLKLQKVKEGEVKLEFDFERDEEKYVYIMAIASTPDVNSAGFIVENKALLTLGLQIKRQVKMWQFMKSMECQ